MDWTSVLEHWVGPTGIAIIAGAIIWGIQLNIAVMKLTSGLARLVKEHENSENKVSEHENHLTRVVIILDTMEKRMEKFELAHDKHLQEYHEMQNRVTTLEAVVKTNGTSP